MKAIYLIAKERLEQVEKHGFDEKHDDNLYNENGEMAQAAGYLIGEASPGIPAPDTYWVDYPSSWHLEWKDKFDKKNDIEKLIIAGALISAEIDRRLRKNG